MILTATDVAVAAGFFFLPKPPQNFFHPDLTLVAADLNALVVAPHHLERVPLVVSFHLVDFFT